MYLNDKLFKRFLFYNLIDINKNLGFYYRFLNKKVLICFNLF